MPRLFFPVLLLCLVAAFFRRVLFGGAVFFFRDFGLYFYPKRLLVASAVRRLQIPFWEDLSAGGVAVLGSYQSAVFYPPALIYYLLPMPSSFMFFVVFHFLVAGAGAYFLLRVWGVRRAPAAVGALLWTFAPSFVSVVDSVAFFTALSYLPWCLAFAKKIFLGGRFRAFAGLAVSFALALLAGAPEPVIFIAMALTVLVACEMVLAARARLPGRTAGSSFLVLAALAVALLAAGVELVPFLDYLRASERTGKLPLDEAVRWSMAPADAALTVLPAWRLYPGRGGICWAGQRWLKTPYLGAAVPFLALWTLLFVRRGRNVFFAAVAVLFLALALGASSPLWRLAWRVVPGFGLIRYAAKFFLPAAFAMSALAAFALDDVAAIERKRPRRLRLVFAALAAIGLLFVLAAIALSIDPEYSRARILPPRALDPGGLTTAQESAQFGAALWSLKRSGLVLVASAAVLFFAGLLKPRRRALAAVVFGCVSLADVMLFSAHLNPVTSSDIYRTPPDNISLVADISNRPGAARYMMTDDLAALMKNVRVAGFADTRTLAGFLMSLDAASAVDEGEVLAWASRAECRSFQSTAELDRYLESHPAVGIVEAAQFEFYKACGFPNTNLLFGLPVVEPGEVLRPKWSAALYAALLDGKPSAEPLTQRLYAVSAVVDWSKEAQTFATRRLAAPVPRAFLIDAVTDVPDDAAALAAVTSPGFDPRREVVLLSADASDAAATIGLPAPRAPDAGPSDLVKWLRDDWNLAALETNSPRPALLYVADNFHPSLRARIDGGPARLYRANYAFRAVPVPPGRHVVTFAYDGRSLCAGIAATALGLVLMIVVWFVSRRPKARPSSAAPRVAP